MEPCFSSGSTVVMVTNGRWFQKNDSDGTSDVFTDFFHVHKSTFNIECNSHSATMSSIHTLLLFEIYIYIFIRICTPMILLYQTSKKYVVCVTGPIEHFDARPRREASGTSSEIYRLGSWRLGHLGTNNGETKSRFSKSEILGLFD